MLKAGWSGVTEFREAEDFIESSGGAPGRSIAWADLVDGNDEDGNIINNESTPEARHLDSLSYSEVGRGRASASVVSLYHRSPNTHVAKYVSPSGAQVKVAELSGCMRGGVSGRHRYIRAVSLEGTRRLQAHGFASYSRPAVRLSFGAQSCGKTEMLRCQTFRPRGCNVWLKRNCLKTVA